jgi:hypothetical protein
VTPGGPGQPKPVSVPSDQYFGNSDITLSGSKDLTSWSTECVTSSSMPPPTQFGGQFLGDYIGMNISGNTAYPIWADTRDAELFICPGSSPPTLCTGTYGTGSAALQANDENNYMASDQIPTP